MNQTKCFELIQTSN